MALTLDDALAQMQERGIEPPPDIAVDGKKYTWAGDPRKPKKKNAWAVLHEWISAVSGKAYVVGRYGIRDEHWAVEPTEVEWSPAEKTAWLEKRKELEKAAEADRKALAEEAVAKATKLWARSRLEGSSDYLQRKQVGAYGVRHAFGSVVVPLWDLAGQLHGLQWIDKDGGKVFGTGTVKEGHFCQLGEVQADLPIAFGEGYATCASAHMATGWPVVACFDAGNLMPVVAAWRKLYPDAQFVMVADDDRYLVQRLCERLGKCGVSVSPADFARSKGGLRDLRWDLPDEPEGRVVELKAKWAKDRCDVWHIEGSITADGVSHMLRLENAGRAKAFAVAKRHGARVILPVFSDSEGKGTDFNDLHVAEGLEQVRAQLLAPPPEPKPEKPTRKNALSPDGGGQGGGQGGGAGGGGGGFLQFPYTDDRFQPKGIRENVYFALAADPALSHLVRYNEFSQEIDKCKVPPWGGAPGAWKPLDDLRLAAYLASAHGLIIGNPVTVEQAVLMAAQDSAYNPVREQMESVVWDGIERRQHWLVDCLGAADNEYVRLVSEFFLLSMVARVFEPGCQMDYMLVLQGMQGQGKSSILKVLAGEYYGGGSFRIGDKDSLQALQGRLLFNFNEMDALSKSESTAIKGFITERTDRFRPPYAKGFQAFPRNCVLTGDTNQGEFLRDATGDRRFWVVHCTAIDVDKMIQWREQLFAEAVHFYHQGAIRYPTHEQEKTLFQPEQERWKFVDVWRDVLGRYVQSTEVVEHADGARGLGGIWLQNRQREFFATDELLTKALRIDVGKIDRAGSMQKSVGNAMKMLGFEPKRWTEGRVRPRGYIRVLESVKTPPVAPSKPVQPGVVEGDQPGNGRDESQDATQADFQGVPAWD